MSQATSYYDNGQSDTKAKQRKVHKWYDARYSDQALDIYSQEWQKRISSWENRLAGDKTMKLNSDRQLNNLDFGQFFLRHPVAAFSLWQVLQACYELDRAVCGTTCDDLEKIESWQALPPFRYLCSRKVKQTWEVSLKGLKERIKSQDADDMWELKIYDILLGVERFERAFASLHDNFAANLEGERFAGWMTKRIEDGIGDRFSMIDQLLEFKENELWRMHAEEEASGEFPNLEHSCVVRESLLIRIFPPC
jgi:hypothetical protein